MNEKTFLSGWKPAGKPYVEQKKDLLLARNKALNKMVELLHKQLIRKGRLKNRSSTFYHPTLRANVYYTRVYDIKSQSKAPYSYDSWLDLGLNQLFVNQSPYNWYDGDPGDENGIYHDKCEILSMEKGAVTAGANANGIKATMTHYSIEPIDYDPEKPYEHFRPKYSLSYPHWSLGDNGGNMIFFNHPKTFIDGRRYSIVYKIKRVPRYVDNKKNDNKKNDGNIVMEYIFYTKAYEQTFENGKEINYFRGYSEVKATTHLITSGKISVSPQMPYINLMLGNVKITKILATNTLKEWSEVEVEPAVNSYDLELKIGGETLYPVGVLGGLGGATLLNDGRILHLANVDNDKNLFVFLTETFYADNDMPTRGAFKWYKEWNSHYCLYVYEKKQNLGFLAPLVMALALVLTIYTGYGGIAAISAYTAATAAMTFAAFAVWTGAILSGIGFAISAMSALGHGSPNSIKMGRIFSFAGAVINISALISNAWTKLSAQVAINASQMSAQGVAVNSGLSQTSSLYATTGFANASSVGVNFTTSTTFGLFASGNTYISPLTAIAISQPVGLSASQIASMSINMLSSAYSAYSDARDIFRPANEFSDDEMPTNDDKLKINFIPMNSQYIKRKHYSILENYDLGLERGTLLYIPSVRDRFG